MFFKSTWTIFQWAEIWEKNENKFCENNCVNSESDWQLNALKLFHTKYWNTFTALKKARASFFGEDTTVLSCPRVSAQNAPVSPLHITQPNWTQLCKIILILKK